MRDKEDCFDCEYFDVCYLQHILRENDKIYKFVNETDIAKICKLFKSNNENKDDDEPEGIASLF